MQDFTHGGALAPATAVPVFGDNTPVPAPRTLPVRFTGTGSEYFRIWIVNLLLLLLTLGLYWPWAKVRRLRYFHANTLVGGHALAFHGNPRQMFKGFLLVLGLFGAYTVATNTSLTATVVAVLAIGALWPALFQRSMRFRLANTSWRGLRLHFSGAAADAYWALLPALVVAAGGVAWSWVQREYAKNITVLLWGIGLVLLVFLSVGPWALWRLKCYQHRHYRWGPVQTDLRLPLGALYAVGLKSVVLYAASVVVLVLLGLVVGHFSTPVGPQGGARAAVGVGLLLWLLMVLSFLGYLAYVVSRWQNLLWSATGCAQVQFRSALRARALWGLTLKNGLLLVLTLGLYWPFAAIAKARLRLEAVCLDFAVDPDSLAAQARTDSADATGDAAADLLGVDIGL